MVPTSVEFFNLLLAALLVGSLFGAWLFLNPAGLSGASYVTVQQHGIRTLNPVMPPLGGATLLFTLASAYLARADRVRLWMLLLAAICLAGIGLVTRFLNQPINAVVMTWRGDPPADWTVLRDQWWQWHVVRLVTGLAAMSLLLGSTLKHAR